MQSYSLLLLQFSHCSLKSATDNTEINECGCVSIKLYVHWNLNFTSQNKLCFFPIIWKCKNHYLLKSHKNRHGPNLAFRLWFANSWSNERQKLINSIIYICTCMQKFASNFGKLGHIRYLEYLLSEVLFNSNTWSFSNAS